MTIGYQIQMWNPTSRKYVVIWEGADLNIAEKLYHKPYYQLHTRRMVRVEIDVMYGDRKKVGHHIS